MLRGVKRIGFDVDNTLYRMNKKMQCKVRWQIYELTAKKLGIPVEQARGQFEAGYKKTCSGRKTLVAMGLAAKEAKNTVQEAIETADIAAQIKPNQGLRKNLQKLRGRGVCVDIVTGTSARLAMKKLKKLGIPQEIFCCRVYGSTRYTKSDGSAYKVWVRKAKCKPKELLYVGDNEHADFKMPRKMGMRAILLRYGEKERRVGRDWVVPSVKRACELLLEELP